MAKRTIGVVGRTPDKGKEMVFHLAFWTPGKLPPDTEIEAGPYKTRKEAFEMLREFKESRGIKNPRRNPMARKHITKKNTTLLIGAVLAWFLLIRRKPSNLPRSDETPDIG
ncbi:hypothetical protein LCGC14_2574880, partial [marine sediment metagenome]